MTRGPTRVVNVRLPQSLYVAISKLSEVSGESMSTFIREASRTHVKAKADELRKIQRNKANAKR